MDAIEFTQLPPGASPAVIELELQVPPAVDWKQARRVVEGACAATGLERRSRGTLASYPGCLHWHFTHGLERGTLEITLWPSRSRLWFKIAANRNAHWIARLLPALKESIEAGLTEAVRPELR